MKSDLRHRRRVMLRSLFLLCAMLRLDASSAASPESQPAVESAEIHAGELNAVFRDNSKSPLPLLSGVDSLINVKEAPGFDAFDPDSEGASAGLNFEHIISGHESPHNRFSPRVGPYSLRRLPDGKSVLMERRANDEPWRVESTTQY